MMVLVFAPHNDDETLGVGGTISKLIKQNNEVYVCEVTSGSRYKTVQAEALSAHKLLGVKETFFLNLPVGKLRNLDQPSINNKISEIVEKIRPQTVFLPFIGDMHIDHRETLESAMVALRPVQNPEIKEIYMYETLSETGWNLPSCDKAFIPNVWFDITETFEQKIKAMQCYKSQLKDYPHPRSIDAIEALAKYRGSTVGVKYAESFMLIRSIHR